MKNWLKTRELIEAIQVPSNTRSYCAIPHSVFLSEIRDQLAKSNYTISDERYLTTSTGAVLTGNYRIADGTDDELAPSITFVNSYNKTRKAEIRASAVVLVCKNGMMGAIENGYYSRKHLGKNALNDFRQHIVTVIGGLDGEFNRLKTNRNEMKSIKVDKKTIAQLVGDMVVNEVLLSTVQITSLLKDLRKTQPENVWNFYNCVTQSLHDSHPSFYDKQHIKFHTYISDKFNLTGSRGLYGSGLDEVSFEEINNEETT
jgi:hypothetical protein